MKRAHEELGYPRFSKQEQLKMVFEEDFKPITTLTKYNFITSEVLDKYIDVSLGEMTSYLYSNLQLLLLRYDVKENVNKYGFWIKKENGFYRVLHKERGEVVMGFKFNSLNDLVIFYAKLLLSNVNKYRSLSPI